MANGSGIASRGTGNIEIVIRDAGASVWQTLNRFTAANTELSASNAADREVAYRKLWQHATDMAARWRDYYQDAEIRVIDTALDDPRKPVSKPAQSNETGQLYHVYVETMQVETITPDFQDAQRAFRRAAREYPHEQIDFDVIEGLAPGEGMQDVAEGVHSGRRVRVMQHVPELA